MYVSQTCKSGRTVSSGHGKPKAASHDVGMSQVGCLWVAGYVIAKHADGSVPDTPEEWLDM